MSAKILLADYVIVGAGTAGSVVAARLSEDPDVSVIVLEAGPHNRGLSVRMPAGIRKLYEAGKLHWDYKSQPEPFAGNRRLPYKLGRVVGGSSAINGMIWVRGHPRDFDDWEAAGCSGWGYSSLEPIFRRIEAYQAADAPEMGKTGPIPITVGRPEQNALSQAFLSAAQEAGERINPNYNGTDQDGFAALQRNIRNGVRGDVHDGYLKQAKRRKNLRIVPNAVVSRIIIEKGRAVAVDLQGASGIERIIASKEVIVCAGAIGTPQILEASGVGNHAVLSRAGVDLVHSLPGVGENLQTHPAITTAYASSRPISILNVTRGLGMLAAGIRWVFTKTGPAATSHFEAGAFIRARPDADRPDCFLIFLPLLMEGAAGQKNRHGFQIFIDLYGVRSRGQTHIVSKDVSQPPEFRFNSLKEQSDVDAFVSAIGLIRKIVGQPAFRELLEGELRPGPGILGPKQLEDWIRSNIGRSHHLAGSCKMGPKTDPFAVVGPDLKVHGLEGLRVADCSIMPTVTSGNTHAAAIVIGEKAAELIRSH